MSPFYASPINLRAFAPTVDVGLAPGEEQKASGLSGERSFWRAVLLVRNPSEGWLVVDFGDAFRHLLLSHYCLLTMKRIRIAQMVKSQFGAMY